MKRYGLFCLFFFLNFNAFSFEVFSLPPDVSTKSGYFFGMGGGIENFQAGGGYGVPLTGSLFIKASSGFLYSYREKGGGLSLSGIFSVKILDDSFSFPLDLNWNTILSFDFMNIKFVAGAGGVFSCGKSFYTEDEHFILTFYMNAGFILRFREEWNINDRDLDPDFYGGIAVRTFFHPQHYFSMEARFAEKFLLLFTYSPAF